MYSHLAFMKVLKNEAFIQMGVPKFYGQYITKQTRAVKPRYNGQASSLNIDMNGIIHQCAQKVFNYEGYDLIEERKRRSEDINKDINILNQQCYDMITNVVMEHVRRIRPKSLIMAIDGPAPLGKIKQQRMRRYLNTSTITDSTLRFSSAAVSPGTTFMIGLDKHIQQWISRSRRDLPKSILYSSHLVPGEGEHKIMEYMRDNKDGMYLMDGGVHVLMGDDADLIFLALLSPLKNIWIARGRDFVDIEQLSRDILSKGIGVEDFTIIAFLLGNDFLPHIISLNNVVATLENAIQAYKNIGKQLVVDGKLDRDTFKLLINTMAASESLWLKEISLDPSIKPIKALELSKTIKQYGYHSDTEIDYEAFYTNWYYFALKPKLEDRALIPFDLNAYLDEMQDIIKDAASSYLNTIEWVYEYYKTGVNNISLTWYYTYDFAPLLIDIASGNFTDSHLAFSDPIHKFFHPLQQLAMILAPHQAGLIPFSLGNLLTNPNSPLIDLYPIEALTSTEGFNTDWQKDIYLPELDPNRVCAEIQPSKIKGIEKLFPYYTANIVNKI